MYIPPMPRVPSDDKSVIVVPITITKASNEADKTLDKIPTFLTSATARLNAIKNRINHEKSSLCDTAQSIIAVKKNMVELMAQKQCGFTVYNYDLRNKNELLYLHTNEALKELAQSIRLEDPRKNEANAIVAVVITSNQLANFINKLKIINKAMPLLDTKEVQKIAEASVTYEQDKLNSTLFLKKRWMSRETANYQSASSIKCHLSPLLSTVEAYANEKNPIDKLVGFLNKRTDTLATARKEWAEFRNVLQGDGGYLIKAEGPLESIASHCEKVKLDIVGKYTVIAAFLAKKGQLQWFEECFEQ